MLSLRYCSIEWTEEGARVVFPGGDGAQAAETEAYPHPQNHHYSVISHRVGYGDDLLGYCREHELAHAVVAQEFFDAPSYVLEHMARRTSPDRRMAVLEEMAVATLQRWVRANERPIIGDCDWDRIKAEFVGYVAQLNENRCRGAGLL